MRISSARFSRNSGKTGAWRFRSSCGFLGKNASNVFPLFSFVFGSQATDCICCVFYLYFCPPPCGLRRKAPDSLHAEKRLLKNFKFFNSL